MRQPAKQDALVKSDVQEISVSNVFEPPEEGHIISIVLYKPHLRTKRRAVHRDVTVEVQRTTDPAVAHVFISGRDFDARKMGLFVGYLDDDEQIDPRIHLTNEELGSAAYKNGFFFHVGSALDVEISLYDTSQCLEKDVMNRHEGCAKIWASENTVSRSA